MYGLYTTNRSKAWGWVAKCSAMQRHAGNQGIYGLVTAAQASGGISYRRNRGRKA